MSEIDKSESRDRTLDQESRIGVFRDTIYKNYKVLSEEIVAYRTVKTYPLSPDDQLPLIVIREKEGKRKAARTLTTEEIEEMTESQIMKTIGHYALSINDSPENCEASALKQYQKLIDSGASEAELQEYIEQRGEYVAKIRLTKDAGLVMEFNGKGHGNYLPYSGVILEEYRDKGYFHKIDYSGASGK